MKATLRKSALVAFALAIGASASMASAQGGPGHGAGYGGGPGHGHGMMMGGGPGYGSGYGPGQGRGHAPGARLIDSLDLTGEQREKILAIREGTRQKNWTAIGQLRAEMFALRRLYFADRVDPDAIVEQQRKVDELRRALLKSRLESRNQVEALLTPEQRTQFREARARRMRVG